ncbi:MAG: hypothetical protein ACJ74O_17065 [Frankiaceae bacterium]
MSTGPGFPVAAHRAGDPEVFVADADVLLGDAADALVTGRRSELLRALDAGTAIALMSEQAFLEIGRMSAKAARGRGVDHDALRVLLTEDYLSRIPVASTAVPGDDCWMPDASDVTDPDDVAHVQLARLVSARAIYSHDRDLRRPGFAPATRLDYDQRIVHLSVLSTRHETERGVDLVIRYATAGTAGAVSWTSVRLDVKPAIVWSAVVLALAATGYLVLAPPERRRRVSARLEAEIERLGALLELSEIARRQLGAGRLITAAYSTRLEVRTASYLVRHPDATMREIARALALTSSERRQLSVMLRAHPSFQLVSSHGWAMGRIRPRLLAEPSSSWVPRTPAM